jgi:hypothetical protein
VVQLLLAHPGVDVSIEVLLGFLFCHCKIIASVYCKFIFLIILLHGFGQDGKTALQLADGGETNEIRNLIQIHMETLPISIPVVLAPASSASDVPTPAIPGP